jgi:hypothetical protein
MSSGVFEVQTNRQPTAVDAQGQECLWREGSHPSLLAAGSTPARSDAIASRRPRSPDFVEVSEERPALPFSGVWSVLQPGSTVWREPITPTSSVRFRSVPEILGR